jgi:hypothetical protein
MFTYVATGGLNAVGCSVTNKTIFIRTEFKEGDIAYESRLARKGKLEKMVIKKINVVNNLSTGGLYSINYQDTLNGIYLEKELVDEAAALVLAEDYYQYQADLALEQLRKLCG